MSSAPTQIAVAPSASIVGTTQIQKDYLDEPMSRQNSLNSRHNRVRLKKLLIKYY